MRYYVRCLDDLVLLDETGGRFREYSSQVATIRRWFRSKVCSVRIGRYHECYDGDAEFGWRSSLGGRGGGSPRAAGFTGACSIGSRAGSSVPARPW